MYIPVGWRYTFKVSDSIAKHVQCEKCGTHYLYVAQREAEGTGLSVLFLDNDGGQRRAADRAFKNLQKALANVIEPVPCVGCGWLQSDMVGEAKRRYRRWMLYIGVTLSAFGVLFAVLIGSIYGPDNQRDKPFSEMWAYAGAIIGCVMVIGRLILVSKYDPNADESLKDHFRRLMLGRTALKAEFDRIVTEASKTTGAYN